MKIKKASLINLTLIIYILCAIITDEGATVMQMGRLYLMAVFGATFLSKHFKLKVNQYVWWLIIFLLFALLSIIWASNYAIAASMSKTLAINVLCMYALMYLIDFRRDRIKVVLKTCIIAPVLLEIRVIISGGIFAFLNARVSGGISGNTIGLCAAFGACMAAYFWLQNKNKLAYGSLFVIDVLIVILSSSRKALLCVFIPILFVYIFNHKDSFLKIIWKIVVVVVLLFVGCFAIIKVPLLYATVGNRIESMLAMLIGDISAADASSLTRFRLIAWGMEWFKQNPWKGYGIDNYRIILHFYHPDYPLSYYAHNNYVELLVDVGVVGFILYYWNYAAIFLRGFRFRKQIGNEEILFIGMLIALMINEYGLVSYYDKYIQILILIIWIVIYRLGKSAEDKSVGRR